VKDSITFINGLFSPAEAADVLLSLINDKIKFHRVKSLKLRNEEQGLNISSEERIEKLKEAKKTVERLVLKAHKEGMILSIKSAIEIELMERSDA
jgi:LAS superfamily LD-carboxypeptidase LdcB